MPGMIFGGYALAVLLAARFIHYQMRLATPPDDRTDDVLLAALAFFAGLFWPLAIPIAIIAWRPRRTPAELRRQADEHREQIAARDSRIADLERQLGIGADRSAS